MGYCLTCMGDDHKRTPECAANHCPRCDGTGQEHTEQKREFRVYPDATGDYHLRYKQTEQHGGMLYNRYDQPCRSKLLNKDVERLIIEFAGLHPEPQLLEVLIYSTLRACNCARYGVRFIDCGFKDPERCTHRYYKSCYQGYVDLDKGEWNTNDRQYSRGAPRRLEEPLSLSEAKRAPGDSLRALIRRIMPHGYKNQK